MWMIFRLGWVETLWTSTKLLRFVDLCIHLVAASGAVSYLVSKMSKIELEVLYCLLAY